jgi:hypothetical protein
MNPVRPNGIQYESAQCDQVHSVRMFGRQMTTFEDWTTEESFKEEDITAAVYNRSCEIRTMIDTTHAQSIGYVDEAKEKQVAKQNKAQKTSSESSLKIGSHVYITTVGLHDKLWEKYKGPFTIIRQARSGNYVVKNVLGEEIADSFPRERLKPVSTVMKERFLKFDRILDHRVSNKGVMEYLVKWQSGLEPDSWEPAENFADPEWIAKYWKDRKDKEGKEKRVEEREKRKPGRPKKINYTLILAVLFFLNLFPIMLAAGYAIEDTFWYCNEIIVRGFDTIGKPRHGMR